MTRSDKTAALKLAKELHFAAVAVRSAAYAGVLDRDDALKIVYRALKKLNVTAYPTADSRFTPPSNPIGPWEILEALELRQMRLTR